MDKKWTKTRQKVYKNGQKVDKKWTLLKTWKQKVDKKWIKNGQKVDKKWTKSGQC